MPFVKFDSDNPIPDRVSYHMPFEVYIDTIKKRGFSPRTLSIITGVPVTKIAEIYELPAEQLEVFIQEDDPAHKNAPPVTPSTADTYYAGWLKEAPYDAARFTAICNILMSKSYSHDPTGDIQRWIRDWLLPHMGFSLETLSSYFKVSVADIELFLSSPGSLSQEVRYRLVTSALRVEAQLYRFLSKTEPVIGIPDAEGKLVYQNQSGG
jgi:hypothetical protein